MLHKIIYFALYELIIHVRFYIYFYFQKYNILVIFVNLNAIFP